MYFLNRVIPVPLSKPISTFRRLKTSNGTAAVSFLLKYANLLTGASKKNIRSVLDRISEESLKPSWDFVGVNDNFPSMATCGCAPYGEISGRNEFT